MAYYWSKSQETVVRIPSTEENGDVIFYKIQIFLGDISWHVKHRYNEFFELHNTLVNDHGVAKDILPSKKLIRSKCPQFIESRRHGLEVYLQKVLKYLKLTVPRVLLEFLDFHLYEVYFLLETLAFQFYTEADLSPTSRTYYNFSTLDTHAISKCYSAALPTVNNTDKRYDLTHLLDFCSQLKVLQVTGVSGNYLKSNIRPNELSYDFKIFKKVDTLCLNGVCLDSIKDLGQLRSNLERLTITKSKMTHFYQILQCDVLHKFTFNQSQVWKSLVYMNLSGNCLDEIDETIALIPNLQVLILDQNQFTTIPNLSKLECLTNLSFGGNLIVTCNELNSCLGNLAHLNLSQNGIRSLKGFSKLYSLESLNLTGNHIDDIEEIGHLSRLPCLEDLKLTGNNVSTIVDYRVKVLEFFGARAKEICLDNEQPLQPELDKVSIRRALRILKEGSVPDILNT